MYHINVTHMKTASIRALRHDTATVLGWVEAGEKVEIRKRGRPVAIMSRPSARSRSGSRPNFAARLKSIYPAQVLSKTATELLAEERGDR
jgi:antitoxin (DNA-binding transcriptional repressor) of toxin-antitoxin stability system